MRIATTKKSLNSPVFDVEEFIKYGCEQLGHTVVQYDWKTQSPAHILKILSGVDIAFIPVNEVTRGSKFNNKTFITGLNALKCKVVLEVIDEPRILPKLRKYVLPHYTRMVWPHTNGYLDRYTKCERIISEPIVGEHYCYHLQDEEKKYDVMFNGSIYSFRAAFIRALLKKLGKHINFKIASKKLNTGINDKYWLNNKRTLLCHPDLNTLYNQSKILLSFGIYADNIKHYGEQQFNNIDEVPGRCGGYPCRIFSYMGSGGFTLADQRKEQDRYFENGIEAVTYNSVDECVAKIEYYLEHEEERNRIAQAGHERYLKDHTIEIRMKRVLEAVNKK